MYTLVCKNIDVHSMSIKSERFMNNDFLNSLFEFDALSINKDILRMRLELLKTRKQ